MMTATKRLSMRKLQRKIYLVFESVDCFFFILYHMQIKLPAQEYEGDEEDIGQLVPAKLQK